MYLKNHYIPLVAFGLASCILSAGYATAGTTDSTVASKQTEASFTDLFASGDFSNWTQLNGKPVGEGWSISSDGVIYRGGIRPGDIITKAHYKDFELRFEWKISEAGNSGIKYRTQGKLGLEYQILDDLKHRDAKDPTHHSASLYDLFAAPDSKPLKPAGEWNNSRILAKGNHIEHWINGEKVIDVEYGSTEWQTAFSESKYKKHKGFGTWTGPILLQDHYDKVWYRKIRVRTL